MAKKKPTGSGPKKKRAAGKPAAPPPAAAPRDWRRSLRRALWGIFGLIALAIVGFALLPVPATPYQISERMRLGEIQYDWVGMDEIAPVMQRAAVAAEDAGYCQHWGFDIAALRHAIDSGMRRGGSTISQQTVKNLYLWQGRSWPRKALEAALTPLVELVWTKRRILQVYLNIIEFDEGVFGVQAAAQHYFGVDAADLSPAQAARLAAILPAPKDRSAAAPSDFTARRAASIRDGAETIRRDGRAECFSG